ncbi:TPR-like protein [Linderina pennispora]|uniref:RNA polymerase II-associated protein 3 n=1 Tax=Linderina pennispora TaxID=61395 RepID=A0A1Y1W9S9_9FUNG|nr:TPR-like protein [Linderina pennispora]ORX69904.1 TPR-like protein [Linderina pennispora]
MQPDRDLAEQFKAKGNAAFRSGNYDSAVAQYTDAIAADPSNPVYFINRAMTQLRLGKYRQAADDCSLALQLDTTNIKALWRRGVARSRLGLLEEAKCDLEAALKIEPANMALAEDLRQLSGRIPAERTAVARDHTEIKPRPSPVGVPGSAQDFERMWREHRNSPGDIYKLLKLVNASDLPSLFRASLEAENLSTAISAIEVARNEYGDVAFAADVLSAFPKVARFSLACLFLDSADKSRIHDILAWLAAKNMDVSALSKMYA